MASSEFYDLRRAFWFVAIIRSMVEIEDRSLKLASARGDLKIEERESYVVISHNIIKAGLT